MKTRLLMLFVFAGFLSLFVLIPNSDASRSIMTVDEMAKKSDAIVIGTIESTWIDVRPFDDYVIIDTAKVKVDKWLKNNKNSETLEIRYYGYWAKAIDDLRGKFISDSPLYSYEPGQRVLLILDHEESTSIMGAGYYPFFEGSFVINDDDTAISQAGEETTRHQIYEILNPIGNDVILIEENNKVNNAHVEPWCAYIGFDKYPQNLFEEFLESQYTQDATFLNFTDSQLKQVPLFYQLIQEADQMDYPLNDRVRFTVSFEEYNKIKNYLEYRDYYEFTHNGKTLSNQLGTTDIDRNYRHPQILLDGKLFGFNGMNFSPVFSDRDVDLGMEYNGTLEEVQKRFMDNTNPNAANIIYFELLDEDIVNLKPVKDALDKMNTFDTKIHKSLDVGSEKQNKVMDFIKVENQRQFNNDESKYTRYFILNDTLYEMSFVIC